MRTRVVCVAVVAAAVLALAGCGNNGNGGGSGGGHGKGSGQSDGTGAAASRSDNDKAASSTRLDFASTTLDGKPFTGASLKDKPTVLWFWAPWCGTCKAQAHSTAAVAKDYAGTVNVLGVAGLDGEASMHRFVSSQGVGNVTHLSDERGDVWKRFKVTQQSTYVLLDGAGKEVDRGSFGGEADLRKRIDGMLN